MKKGSKRLAIALCIVLVLGVSIYVTAKITSKTDIVPTFTSKISTMDTNKVWVGTFNLVWNDLLNEVVKEKIEFEDGESELANELNKQYFTEKELSSNSYYKTHGKTSNELKKKIENEIKQRFNEESKILDRISWNDLNGYILYAMLKKEFTYLEPFSAYVSSINFNNSEKRVRCFGADAQDAPDAGKNVEVLFYNSKDDFAIKLKTKEGDEVILYKNPENDKSFFDTYEELKSKEKEYTGSREFTGTDRIKIPFIKLQEEINYDELCGKTIKNTSGMYIKQALQTIDFELNDTGGSVRSEAALLAVWCGISEIERDFIFDSSFVLFLKEEKKDLPYLALNVDNTDVLIFDE